MSKIRTEIINDREFRILEAIYIETKVAADQIALCTRAKNRFASIFNGRAKTTYTGDQVANKLIVLRKSGHLKRLGDYSPPSRGVTPSKVPVGTPDETTIEVIKEVYSQNDYPSDRLRLNPKAMQAFAREVNRRAGTTYSVDQIGVLLFRIRKTPKKYGTLPHLGHSFEGPHFS